ncbi:Protein OSB2, chloroplastic-like protein [Melia azedarach]|uniref:Protein OSB2, chloroplastic-like protein n=1 Tax=Melia azedarach TaxID=155640 RepID=A0ACC1WV92_MELAZ|nr:Protein OSB2, chloroplastic-like protein [Melia azedarach]
MNALRRVATHIVRSRSTVKRVVLRPTASFTPQYSSKAGQSSEAATKTAVDWPRPSEIPFQAKVANSVNLIGYVDAPIQFKTSPDGKDWAGTVIIQKAYSVPLWIPVLFQGDLAHIAASHLKKDDHVHIAGQLTADPPAVDGLEGQANVQVMVHSLNFIEPSFQTNNSFTLKKQEAAAIGHSASKKKGNDAALRAWRDLLDNPQQWQDCRSDKLKGLVSKRYPDFRRKDGSLALWLNSAPDWVFSELEGVVSDVQTYESNDVKKSEELEGVETYKSNKRYKAMNFSYIPI